MWRATWPKQTAIAAILLLSLTAELASQATPGEVVAAHKIGLLDVGTPADLTGLNDFGYAVASIGDIDADGTPDIAVGDPFGSPGTLTGTVWIIRLNADGTVKSSSEINPSTSDLFGGTANFSEFGHSLASLGDLDGDDIDDLVVGSPKTSSEVEGEGGVGGAVWILFLDAVGGVKDWTRIASHESGFNKTLDAFDQFGSSVACLGDVDGDGVNDIAVGAHRTDDGGQNRGAVWVLTLNTNGTVKSYKKLSAKQRRLRKVLPEAGRFGQALAADDLDGNGFKDLVVAAPGSPVVDTQAVVILFLKKNARIQRIEVIADSDRCFVGQVPFSQDFAFHYPVPVAVVKDLDGLGTKDLVVGSTVSDSGKGALHEWLIRGDGFVLQENRIAEGMGGFAGPLPDDAMFGSSVVDLGDIDGDGTTELVVGAIDLHEEGAIWILSVSRVEPKNSISRMMVLGDRVVGEIGPWASHLLAFDGVAGAQVVLKCKRIAGGMHPRLSLLSPTGDDVATADESFVSESSAKIVVASLPETGRYTAIVLNHSSAGGVWSLASRGTRRVKVDQSFALETEGATMVELDAVACSTIRRLSIRGITGAGCVKGEPVVVGLKDPDGVAVSLPEPTSVKPFAVTYKNVCMPKSGVWQLEVADAGGAGGCVRVSARVKAPVTRLTHYIFP